MIIFPSDLAYKSWGRLLSSVDAGQKRVSDADAETASSSGSGDIIDQSTHADGQPDRAVLGAKRPDNGGRPKTEPPRGSNGSGNGSREAQFEVEALAHLRGLYQTAYRLTRNPQDAEDLVQETYLRAYRAFDKYKQGTNIRGWLYTILCRIRTDDLRKAGRTPEMIDLPDDDRLGVPVQDPASRTEDITRALASLSEYMRTTIVLHDLQGFSYAEVARMLKVPIGTVMSRLHRGRMMLRAALENGRTMP